MNKGVVVTGIVGAIALAFGVSNLSAKKHAADKLTISLKKFQIKNASFTNGILFKVFLNITNPTPTKLSFTKPFVQIFLKNEKGEPSAIASSENDSSMVVLNGRENTEMAIELRLPLMAALKLPNLLSYLVTQFLDKTAKKTKKIIVEFSTKAEGMNISSKSEILI